MFDSREEAEAALRACFEPPLAAAIARALVPAILLEPIPGAEPVLGGTRLGGVPDLSRGMAWPRPPLRDDVEEVIRRLWGPDEAGRFARPSHEANAEDLRRRLLLRTPYAFLAQIDLAEAATLGTATAVLPPEGRLLFFADPDTGPGAPGAESVRVIWDRSPIGSLAPAKAPDALEPGYCVPAKPVRLRPTLRLPYGHSPELSRIPGLGDIWGSEWGRDDAQGLRDAYWGALGKYNDNLHPAEAWTRQQLLGIAVPEQKDPRYEAVELTEFGSLSSEERRRYRAEIHARALDWRLLAQIDIEVLTNYQEGTVYFLMRDTDLEQRRFERVFGIWQST